MSEDPTIDVVEDPIRKAAKLIADEPPEIVPGSEDLPAEVRDGEIDEDAADAEVDEEEPN